MDRIRHTMQSFLQIENPQSNMITLQNLTDFETSCYINRVWSWGDKDAIEQLYKQLLQESKSLNFWAATPSMGIVKRHTGLPGMIVNVLTDMVIADMNDITITESREFEWEDMLKEIDIEQIVSEAISETLIVGDGAFIVSIDTNVSKFPLLEFVPADRVEYTTQKGRITEVIVKEPIEYGHKRYVLEETRGYGYIYSKLYDGNNEVALSTIPALANIKPVSFDKSFMMAVPLMFFKSKRFKGRGKSIYSGKADSYDSLDETWSQWMDALRKGRSKEYIPESFLPRNPNTGVAMKPNDFDHAFITIEGSMQENASNEIKVVQPTIPHESYLSTYITALDLCLQGVISPSTLGIDVKKLDNADAQREKEKTTLYTRNKIVSTLQKVLPQLIDVIFKSYDLLNKKPLMHIDAEIPFGEYANPSFESQVETVAKAKSAGVMSVEASVDELYGDSKDEDWKADEVARIKSELGIETAEEPALNAPGNLIGFTNEV